MNYAKDSQNILFVNPTEQEIAKFGLTEITEIEFESIRTTLKPITLEDYQNSAKAALVDTSETVERIMEAVSLGNTTLTTADVVAFMQYRAALRAEVSATVVGTLPTQPPYPAGT